MTVEIRPVASHRPNSMSLLVRVTGTLPAVLYAANWRAVAVAVSWVWAGGSQPTARAAASAADWSCDRTTAV